MCDPSRPCAPPPGCTPDQPCRPPSPPNCKEGADGAMTCTAPAECAGRTDGPCAPPPWCKPTADGAFDCKPPEPAMAMGGPNAPCAPPAANASAPPQPCGPPVVHVNCTPGPGGQVQCAPPPNCGGAAFEGGGVAGCAPPPFCTANAAGTYDCKPPEDCRATAAGGSRCAPAPIGAACQKQLQGEAASGAFVPCAPPPTSFCPPPPPGAPAGTNTCRDAPPPMRFCAPGEAQFPQDHPANAPPRCVMPPSIENGQYRSPAAALGAQCVPPPPGEWPPAQAAPAPLVWCPPAGFAPPPMNASDLGAWKDHVRGNLPPQFANSIERNQNGGPRCAPPPAPCINGAPPVDLDGDGRPDLAQAANSFGLFAPPQFDGRLFNGSFVGSDFQDDLGMKKFNVLGTEFFREIKPDLQGNASVATAAGNSLFAAHDRAAVEAHNVPSGLLSYRGTGDPFRVTFDGSVETGQDEGRFEKGDGFTVIHRGNWSGIVIGDTKLNGTSIEAQVDAKNPVFFMAVPPSGLDADTRLDIAKGVARGKVFAEISLVARNDTIAEDVAFYSDPETFSVDVKNVTPDAITLDINGEGDGEALVFTVDRETLTTPLSELNVTIDGVTMFECESFEEMTGSASKGGCFHIVANESVIRISVMPEHFSQHTLVIGSLPAPVIPDETSAGGSTSEESETEPTTTETEGTTTDTASPTATPATSKPAEGAAKSDVPAPGFAVILVAVAAVAMFARRRKSG